MKPGVLQWQLFCTVVDRRGKYRGSKLVFTADGTSFTASMRDYNDKEWGTMTCQR